MNDSANSVLALFQPEEIRRKAHFLLEKASLGKLSHVEVDLSAMGKALVATLEATKRNYPDFQIPPYGVWRDFETGGIDRWGALAGARAFESAEEMLASAADLAAISIYMKTRRPDDWVFQDPMTGTEASGTEASALAAFHMFASGAFSSDMGDPYRVDAETLIRMETVELAGALQWDPQRDADLLGELQAHLKRLGEALALRSDLFSEGEDTRPGLLATQLAKNSGSAVDAGTVLDRLLESLAPVWKGGALSGDITLGDCFAHSEAPGPEFENLYPFHMCAQEMVYSLVEPFAWAGWEVAGLDVLTAPADDRHVGLFVKSGVLKIRDGDIGLSSAEARQDRMIELRAVSVALTDRLADMLCAELDVPSEQLPLSCILEAGSARAGGLILLDNEDEAKKLGRLLNPGAVFWLPFRA